MALYARTAAAAGTSFHHNGQHWWMALSRDVDDFGYLNSCNAYNAWTGWLYLHLYFSKIDFESVKAIVLPVCWLCISNTGCICEIYIAGWWLTYPSEKYESVGIMNFPTEWKVIKFHGSKPPTRYYRTYIPYICIYHIPSSNHPLTIH